LQWTTRIQFVSVRVELCHRVDHEGPAGPVSRYINCSTGPGLQHQLRNGLDPQRKGGLHHSCGGRKQTWADPRRRKFGPLAGGATEGGQGPRRGRGEEKSEAEAEENRRWAQPYRAATPPDDVRRRGLRDVRRVAGRKGEWT